MRRTDRRARDFCSGTKYKQQTLGKRDPLLWGRRQRHSTTTAGREVHSGSGTPSLCSMGFPTFSKGAASWEKSGEARLPQGREHTDPAFLLSPRLPTLDLTPSETRPVSSQKSVGNGAWNTDFPSLSSNICQDQYTPRARGLAYVQEGQ